MLHLDRALPRKFYYVPQQILRDISIDMCGHVNCLIERAFQQTFMTTTTTIAIMHGVQVPNGGVCFDPQNAQDAPGTIVIGIWVILDKNSPRNQGQSQESFTTVLSLFDAQHLRVLFT